MTTRAALHALIDILPDAALGEAETRLRALEPVRDAEQADVASRIRSDSAPAKPPAPTLSPEDRCRLEEAAANGSAIAWAILHAQPLGPEFNSERPHNLSRSNDWFADDIED